MRAGVLMAAILLGTAGAAAAGEWQMVERDSPRGQAWIAQTVNADGQTMVASCTGADGWTVMIMPVETGLADGERRFGAWRVDDNQVQTGIWSAYDRKSIALQHVDGADRLARDLAKSATAIAIYYESANLTFPAAGAAEAVGEVFENCPGAERPVGYVQ